MGGIGQLCGRVLYPRKSLSRQVFIVAVPVHDHGHDEQVGTTTFQAICELYGEAPIEDLQQGHSSSEEEEGRQGMPDPFNEYDHRECGIPSEVGREDDPAGQHPLEMRTTASAILRSRVWVKH